jgi:hypothetical protein
MFNRKFGNMTYAQFHEENDEKSFIESEVQLGEYVSNRKFAIKNRVSILD